MYQEEKTFVFRFSLEASFPDDYSGDQDEHTWVREWEAQMKPQLMKLAFESLRHHPGWTAHVRNRGISAVDEIEIVVAKDFSTAPPLV